MGRPRKQGMDYFPHDVDASQDEKIEAIRSMFGNDGYAFYFITLERIYRSETGEFDVSNKLMLLTLANKVMVKEQQLLDMIQASIEFGLFDADEYLERRVLTSNGIRKRSVEINTLRDKWRNKKLDGEDSFLDGKLGFSQEKTTVFPEEKCIKESKEKESKEKKIESKGKGKEMHGDNVALTAAEYSSLISSYGQDHVQKCIDELNEYKRTSGKEYANDALCIRTWVTDRINEKSQKAREYKPANKNATKPVMQVHLQSPVQLTEQERKDLNDYIRRLEGGAERK